MPDLDQIYISVTDIIPPDNFATVDAGTKTGTVYTKEQDNEWRKEVEANTQSGIKGVLKPNTPYDAVNYPYPKPWTQGDSDLYEKYDVNEAGVFPSAKKQNGDPLEVTSQELSLNEVQIWVKNGVAEKHLKAMPQATLFIPNFTGSVFPLVSTTSDLIQRTHENSIWQLTPGETALVTDVPGVSSKWVAMSEVITNKTQGSTDVFTATQSGSGLDSSTFSGFGFLYGALKNFNRVVLPIWQRASTPDEVTKVYLRIKEDGYQGTLLYDGFKDVTIPQGTQQDVIFDFSLIENSTNKPIWVEFVCDGLTRLNTSNLTAQPYRYKTTGQGITDFNPTSTAGSSNVNPMAISFKNLKNELSFIPELLTDLVEVGNEKPITSDGVFDAFEKYDAKYENIIDDAFDILNTSINGDKVINSSNATIRGWGQLLGKLTDFNRIGYVFNAINSAEIPTQVKCVLRKDSSTGAIIFNKTITVSLTLNVSKTIYFDLDEVFTNTDNSDIFISFFANGAISLMGGLASISYDSNHTVRFTTAIMGETVASPSNALYKLYVEVIKGEYVKRISENEVQRIKTEITGFSNPDVLLTSKVWVYPNFQYNVFNKNVVVPNFGDNLNNYRLDYSGTIGQQFERGFRLNNAAVSLNQNITLNLLKGRNALATKTQTILSATAASGTGVNRKVLIIGDSTVDGGDINIPLKAIFDTDPMDVTFLGTRGDVGLKHEGRGGWTIADYYGYGRKLFTVNVSGLTTPPTTGAIYKQTAGNDFTVVEVNITGGTGYFKLEMATGSADLATNGTLTKQSGTGQAVINYTGSTVDSSNPFYSPTTLKFDLGTYLTNTSQSIASNDWVIFQLGINDVFNMITLSDATAKVNTMMAQFSEILANITAYNSGIRVGIVITIPPANQDAFAANYANGQLSEIYKTTGLLTFQKRLIEVYDNETQRALNRYLISAHLNLDTDYNFPSADVAVNSRNTKTVNMQNNGVHPDVSGNYQIADMYAGVIKYFA